MAHRLLVVEDDPDIAGLYRQLLGAEYSWSLARTVKDARRRLSDSPLDAVVLDWRLPDGNGLSLLREIREDERYRHLLVLMVTGNSGPERCIEALETGADDFLEKPVHPDVLLARLHSLTRRKGRSFAEPRVFELDGLRYDPAARSLTINGKARHLHPKELRLLEFFLDRPNVVHAHSTIWDEVWGPRTKHWDHALVAAISSLRRSLGRWGERIDCRKGLGYLLATTSL